MVQADGKAGLPQASGGSTRSRSQRWRIPRIRRVVRTNSEVSVGGGIAELDGSRLTRATSKPCKSPTILVSPFCKSVEVRIAGARALATCGTL